MLMMFLSAWRQTVAIGLALAAGLFLPQSAVSAQPTATRAASHVIEAESDGPTLFEAQQNAIRLALQQALPQIIAADRRIVNDDVATDRILSSLNGFVEHVAVLGQRRDANGAWVRLQVHVSTQEIGNFVRMQAPGGTQVSGLSMLAESLREEETRRFRNDFLGRFLRGYPHQALEARVSAARVNPGNPRLLDVSVTYALHPRFASAFFEAARSLACDAREVAAGRCSPHTVCVNVQDNGGLDRRAREQCVVLAAGPGARGAYPSLDVVKEHRGDPLAFAFRFLDRERQRVRPANGCFDWTGGHVVPRPASSDRMFERRDDPLSTHNLGNFRTRIVIDTSGKTRQYAVPLDELRSRVDLQRVESIEVAAMLAEQPLLNVHGEVGKALSRQIGYFTADNLRRYTFDVADPQGHTGGLVYHDHRAVFRGLFHGAISAIPTHSAGRALGPLQGVPADLDAGGCAWSHDAPVSPPAPMRP